MTEEMISTVVRNNTASMRGIVLTMEETIR